MKNVLITGANRGIGLELCRQLAENGKKVIAVCRSTSEALEALGVTVISDVDITQKSCREKLSAQLEKDSIELLIQNAGIFRNESLNDFNSQTIEEQFETNALAPLALTVELLEKLSSGSKVAFITSRMGSLADNTSGGRYGYRMSKAALNAAGVSLAHDLKPRNIAVGLLHPGYVKTDMTDHNGDVTPSQSAAGLLNRIQSLSVENSGSFWHANGEPLPW